MTPEEEQRLRAAIMRTDMAAPRQGPVTMGPSGMTGPYTDDAALSMQDHSAKQKRLAEQMRRGQEQMAAKGPQGRSIDTGWGELYMGPTWAESLSDVVDKGVGAYSAYKAGEELKEVDAAAAESQAAAGRLAQGNLDRTFGLDETKVANQVDQFGETLGQNQQKIDNQVDQFGKTFGLEERKVDNQVDQFGQTMENQVSQFAQTLAQGDYQFGVGQENKERDQALAESEVVPYLIDGEVVNTVRTMIEGRMVNIDPDTGQPVDIQGGTPLPTSSGRSATPKYLKTFYRPDGTRQETIVIGGTRHNVGGENDGEPFKQDGAREAISEEKLATELGKFEVRTEGTRQLAEKFNQANVVMEDYGIDIFSGDNPMGFLEQVPGFLGGAVRTVNDLRSADPQAAEKFSVINDVIAQLVREQAGLSQTAKEIETISNTYGRNWYDRPDVVVKAWPRLQKLISKDIASKTASTHGQVLNEYRLSLKAQGQSDWTRIGVGLDSDMPPSWVPKPGSANEAVKTEVDRRGRPKPSTEPVPTVQSLTDEEEDIYKKFPNLRPAP